MKTLIGIRREDKNHRERRVPLIPAHVRELMRNHPIEIRLQPSSIRVFSDEEYRREEARVEEDLSACAIVLGIKEMPLDFFQREKVYLFFSHTTKGQSHNVRMLKRMMDLGVTLIDYEKIANDQGQRLIFFGRLAGQAGLIDVLWALGKRLEIEGINSPFLHISQTFRYQSLVEAKELIQKVGWEIHKKGLDPSLAPLIVGFAGYGHVSQGAQEIFGLLPFEEARPEDLRRFVRSNRYAANKVYKVVFKEEHLVESVTPGEKFELRDYYSHPEKYRPILESHIPYLTVLVNGIYWSPRYPKFLTKKFVKKLFQGKKQPRLRVIGDISCDVEGALECTLKVTSLDKPVFVYDAVHDKAIEGFEGKGPVVMAVDNLPAEISLESSLFFSQMLKPFIPGLAAADFSADFSACHLPGPLKKAVILFRGKFTPDFEYMKKFVV